MSHQKVIALEEVLKKQKPVKSKADYVANALSGKLNKTCSIDDFVGTQAQINSEKKRRELEAEEFFLNDLVEHKEKLEVTIGEIYKLTVDQTPPSLFKATPKLYEMAYKAGSNHSEIYTNYMKLVDDVYDVVKLVR